jgi:hypothetical protein
MKAKDVDTSKAYKVAGYSGIAFRVRGPLIELVGYSDFDEPEEVISENIVLAVMIGDDRVHEIDVDDLTPIKEDDYCSQCGQIGCGHG